MIPKTMKFNYTNWRGEFGTREIFPETIKIYYGKTEWHQEEQWLMQAYDVLKHDIRTFAMKDIQGFLD